jgi:hypothetical protein
MIERTIKTRVPKLRVPESVKVANDFEHTRAVMDHYISCASFIDEAVNSSVRDTRVFYSAYNNQLPDSYFRYVTNPLNSANAEYTNWPAKLRPYSIIRPNVDLLEGEYERRPFSYTIKVNNQDSVNNQLDQQYQLVLQVLQQQFVNALNNKGYDSGIPNEEVELPAKVKAKFSSNYKDQRAIMGEAALDIIVDRCQLEQLFKRLFRDWLIAGECYTFKTTRRGQIVYERVSPLDIDFDKSPDTEDIEDGQWAVRRIYSTPSDVHDQFYDELSEKEVDIIEDENGHLSYRSIGTGMQGTIRDDQDLRRSKVVIFHVTWKYLTKIGILTYPNQFGELEEVEVPESYKPNKEAGESIEWYWVNEVWEGYKISNDIYLGIKPIPSQRNTVNNLSSCKLPYNGKRFSDTHAQNTSIVEMGLPYETLHRILHFNLEKTIAKSKGKIALIDQNVIPKKYGWDEEKFFYWAEATGFALIDRNQPGVDKTFNQYTTLDLGLYQHISSLIEIMEYVKQEWDELLGITRQRKGQVKANDTVRGTQSAISQSSVISEKVFSRFEEFVRVELQGLLDVSKLAWVDGFQATYQSDDMRSAILQIDPAQYIEADLGVTISRSARDLENLEMVRQQVQAFAQNGVAPSTIINVVQAKSLSKLRSILEEAEAKTMEANQNMAISEQEAAERIEMIKGQFEEVKGAIEEKLINTEYDRKETIEHIKGTYSTLFNKDGDGDNNDNNIPDGLEVRKQFHDESVTAQDLALKKEKMVRDDVNKDKDRKLKEKEVQMKEKQMVQKTKEMQMKEKIEKTKLQIAKQEANQPKPKVK